MDTFSRTNLGYFIDHTESSFHNTHVISSNPSLLIGADAFENDAYGNIESLFPAPQAVPVESPTVVYHPPSPSQVLLTVGTGPSIVNSSGANQTDGTSSSIVNPSNANQVAGTSSSIGSPSNSAHTLETAETRPSTGPTDVCVVQTKNLLDSTIFAVASTSTAVNVNRLSPSANIPLSAWFNHTFEGRNLISLYNSQHNPVFTTSNRNEIVRLVLDREYNRLPEIPSISSSRFVRIRDEIIELFPRELPGTYYSPHVKKTQYHKSTPAKGKLLYQHNFRKAKQKKKASALLPKTTQPLTTSPTPTVDSDTKGKLDFLSKHLEPWLDVVTNWESTFVVRQQILKSCDDAQLYFDKVPCLKQPLGYQLLERDFYQLYPDKANCLDDKWLSFRACVIELLQNSREPNSEIDKDTISKFPKLQGDALDLAVVYVLPSMIKRCTPLIHEDVIPSDRPKKGRKRKNKESLNPEKSPWNPTAAEVRRGLIFHIATLNNKEEDIESTKEFMRTKKLKFQPRPVIVGPLEKPESIEVLVNKTYYQARNIVEAIKISFYIFFALGLKYPPEAKSVWLLIQKVIFDINTAEDENLPVTLTTLIGDIKVIYEKLHSK